MLHLFGQMTLSKFNYKVQSSLNPLKGNFNVNINVTSAVTTTKWTAAIITTILKGNHKNNKKRLLLEEPETGGR